MCYYLGFGSFSLVVTVVLYAFVTDRTAWHPYVTWLAALSGTTFVMYGVDKIVSPPGKIRTPENLLHGLSLAGGFLGGWLGRIVFDHKTNVQKHPAFPTILLVSAIGHCLLIYYLFFRGG
jgi:uncharacterized membrane protein YsdA (DUF1294 family)